MSVCWSVHLFGQHLVQTFMLLRGWIILMLTLLGLTEISQQISHFALITGLISVFCKHCVEGVFSMDFWTLLFIASFCFTMSVYKYQQSINASLNRFRKRRGVCLGLWHSWKRPKTVRVLHPGDDSLHTVRTLRVQPVCSCNQDQVWPQPFRCSDR